MPAQDVVQVLIGDLHMLAFSFNNFWIDASGEKSSFVIQVPKTGSITHVGFRVASVSSSQTLRAGIETLSGGAPSGSQYGGSAVGTQASPAADTFYEVALATPATAV